MGLVSLLLFLYQSHERIGDSLTPVWLSVQASGR